MRVGVTPCAWLACFIGISLAFGCSSDLSRSRAKSILSEQPLFTSPVASAPWRAGGFDEWTRRGGKNSSKLASGISGADGSGVRFVVPVHRAIDEITGILTDVPLIPNARVAEFRWSLVDVPEGIRRLIVAGDRGTALFIKYDDGWRIDNSLTSLTSQLSMGSAPALPIPPDEQRDITDDLAQETRKATEARRQKEELDRKIAEEGGYPDPQAPRPYVIRFDVAITSKEWTKPIRLPKMAHVSINFDKGSKNVEGMLDGNEGEIFTDGPDIEISHKRVIGYMQFRMIDGPSVAHFVYTYQ